MKKQMSSVSENGFLWQKTSKPIIVDNFFQMSSVNRIGPQKPKGVTTEKRKKTRQMKKSTKIIVPVQLKNTKRGTLFFILLFQAKQAGNGPSRRHT